MRVEDCYTLSQIIRSAIAGGLDPAKMEISVEMIRAGGVLPPEKVSLRDQFAGQAMQALAVETHEDLQEASSDYEPDRTTFQLLASAAYQVADAMLEARAGGAT